MYIVAYAVVYIYMYIVAYAVVYIMYIVIHAVRTHHASCCFIKQTIRYVNFLGIGQTCMTTTRDSETLIALHVHMEGEPWDEGGRGRGTHAGDEGGGGALAERRETPGLPLCV